mmetsp:Transcript_24695/g.35456  ORF Transcript_24695/g.35456 Transcript_24695/m.35456 type:complete len:389 (+) Transcript_24695:3571-4737(+)
MHEPSLGKRTNLCGFTLIRIDQEQLIEQLQVPHLAKTIFVHFTVIPRLWIQVRSHPNDCCTSLDRLLTFTSMQVILPEHVNLLPSIGFLCIFMKHYRLQWCIEVISESESTDTDSDLFTLEYHWLIGIVRHANLEVSSREAEARRPERLQLRHVQHLRLALRLSTVTQIPRRHSSLVVTITHDRSGIPSRVPFWSERALHIREIRTEHGHVVVGGPPLLDDLAVPVPHELAVRVHLHHEALAAVHAVAHVSGRHGSRGILGIHVVHGDLAAVSADRLRVVLLAGHLQVQAAHVPRHGLVHGAHEQPLGMICARKGRCDGLSTLEVSIRGDHQEDGFLAVHFAAHHIQLCVRGAGGRLPEARHFQADQRHCIFTFVRCDGSIWLNRWPR